MRETLGRLMDLQRADQSVVEIQRRRTELDKEIEGATKELAAAKAGADAAHKVLQEAQAASQRKEMDLKGRESQIQQLETSLNGATSNKEYQGILLKIATIKAENGKVEDEILRAMDEVEGKERLQEAARAKVREAEAGMRAAEARLAQLRADLDRELAEATASRQALAATLPAEALRVYERIRAGNKRSGIAVVAVHGEYCQGCQMRVTPQEVTELVQAQRILVCRTCQRILVYES